MNPVRSLWMVTACMAATVASGDGIVILDSGVGADDYPTQTARFAPDGSIYLLVVPPYMTHGGDYDDCGMNVIATDSSGTMLPTFGQGGRLALAECMVDLEATASGFYTLRTPVVEQRNTAFVTQWTSPQYYETLIHGGSGGGANTAFARQADGKVVAGGRFVISAMGGYAAEWTAVRLTTVGAMDPDYAAGSVLRQTLNGGGNFEAFMRSMHPLANGQLLVSGRVQSGASPSTYDTVLSRYNPNGTIDFSFGTNSLMRFADSFGKSALDATGRVYLASTHGHVTRLAPDYSVDGGYAGGVENAQLRIVDIEVDSAGRAVIFGSITSSGVTHGYIARFNTSGNADTTFNSSGVINFDFPRPIVDFCRGALQPADLPVLICPVSGPADAGAVAPIDVALARFTVGGALDASFGATQADSDQYPDPIIFPDVTAPFGAAAVPAAPVTISGTNVPAAARFLGTGAADYSVGCTGTFQTIYSSGYFLVNPGQTLCVRQDAPGTAGAASVLKLFIGGRIATFRVIASSTPADVVPDAFTFAPQDGVALSTVITSNAVTVQGISGYSPVNIVNGSYDIGCAGQNGTINPGAVINGDKICVKHVSSAAYSTATTTTLTIGGVQATFTSTTLPYDTTPDAFAFAAKTSVAPGAMVLSNNITVSGITDHTTISIAGGEYSVGCNSFTSAPGQVSVGEIVCVRQQASAQWSTTTTATLTIGGVSADFAATTVASNGGGSSSSSGGGGSFDPLLLGFGLLLLSRRMLRHESNFRRSNLQ